MSTLYAHTADVKGLCATKNNGFISVSRDLNAKIWEINRLFSIFNSNLE